MKSCIVGRAGRRNALYWNPSPQSTNHLSLPNKESFEKRKVLCFVIVVCYGASNVAGYLAVAVIELVFCIIYFFVFAGKYDTQLTFIHWGWSDFLRCAIACLLFLITSLITLLSRSDGAGIAGAVFGLLAGILFGYDGYMTIPLLRKPHAAVPTEHLEGV
uniref:Proteolipid protein 2 n=1 Tax=Xenopus tropicalis TaxID=8364 RepID=A0A803J848_XENTR